MRKIIALSLTLIAMHNNAAELSSDDEMLLQKIELLDQQVADLEREFGPFSEHLFLPLVDMADAQIDLDATVDATDTLHRAMNIAHRNEGVFTPKQLELIDRMTEMALAHGEFGQAGRHQKFAFFVREQDAVPDSADEITAYATYADWLMNTGQPRRARRYLSDALEIAERGDQNPLPIAIQMQQTRRLEGNYYRPKQLIKLLEQGYRGDQDTLVQAYLEIADAYTLSKRPKDAQEYYAKVLEISPQSLSTQPQPLSIRRPVVDPRRSEVDAYRVHRNALNQAQLQRMTFEEELEDEYREPAWFLYDVDGSHLAFIERDLNETQLYEDGTKLLIGQPILFSEDQMKNLLPYRLHNGRTEIRIELSFTVTETGNLKNIEVLESNAPNRVNRLVTNALKRIYYRPAIVDGSPVARDNVTLTQTFYSDPSS